MRLPADLLAPMQSQLPYQPARPVLASVSAFAAGPSSSRVARNGAEPAYPHGGPAYPQTGPAYTPTAPSPYGNGSLTGVPVSGVPVSGAPVSGVPMLAADRPAGAPVGAARPGHPGRRPATGRRAGRSPVRRRRRRGPAAAGAGRQHMVVAVGGTGRG